MELLQIARQLANYINTIEGFDTCLASYSSLSYNHMGAVLTDAILQAGVNYKTVVAPRVKNIIKYYPEAKTTSIFFTIIQSQDIRDILNWYHPEKPNRLYKVTTFLYNNNVDTEEELRRWLKEETNCLALLEIKGIGPKTVDYLKGLVNISSVAVDRHIQRFVETAGINCHTYYEIKVVVEFAADLLNISRSQLDHAIWTYMISCKINK